LFGGVRTGAQSIKHRLGDIANPKLPKKVLSVMLDIVNPGGNLAYRPAGTGRAILSSGVPVDWARRVNAVQYYARPEPLPALLSRRLRERKKTPVFPLRFKLNRMPFEHVILFRLLSARHGTDGGESPDLPAGCQGCSTRKF